MITQIVRARDEVLKHFSSIALALQGAAFVIRARITAQRMQGVRSEGDISRQRGAPRHIADMRVKTPVLMYDQNAAARRFGAGWTDEITAHLAGAVRRSVKNVVFHQSRIAGFGLLRRGVVWHQGGGEHADRQPANGVGFEPVQEIASRHRAMGVCVIELERALRDLGVRLWHRLAPTALGNEASASH